MKEKKGLNKKPTIFYYIKCIKFINNNDIKIKLDIDQT